MKMLDMRQAVNRFGIEVKKCCASCAFKSITNDVALRRCNLHRHKVRPHNCCRAWRMSEGLRHAGEKPLPTPSPVGRILILKPPLRGEVWRGLLINLR